MPGTTPSSCVDARLPSPAIPGRVWRLTHTQFANTIRAAFTAAGVAGGPTVGIRLPFDDASGTDRFTTRARTYGLAQGTFADLLAATEMLARKLVAGLGARACAGKPGPDFDACAAALIQKVGPALFRRPLAAPELAQYTALASKQRALGDAEALAYALRALMMSPATIFRFEVGAVGVLTPHEVASALAFTLTDAPPDASLAAAADRGQLAHPRRDQGRGAALARQPRRQADGAALREGVLRLRRCPRRRQAHEACSSGTTRARWSPTPRSGCTISSRAPAAVGSSPPCSPMITSSSAPPAQQATAWCRPRARRLLASRRRAAPGC
jgi:hypothetical protein